jgi:hypothetical protein
LWNITSRIVLAVTAPIWFLPVKRLNRKWIAIEQKRIEQAQSDYVRTAETPNPVNYKRLGFLYGITMFVGLTLLLPSISLIAIGQFTMYNLIALIMKSALSNLFWCGIGGFAFGFIMHRKMQKKGDAVLHLTFDSLGRVGSSEPPNDSTSQIESPE